MRKLPNYREKLRLKLLSDATVERRYVTAGGIFGNVVDFLVGVLILM